MMDDKELADRVVALGVVEYWGPEDKEFVRDWRVYGALWEKLYGSEGVCSVRCMIEGLTGVLENNG